ncbi:enoyl-CoA hydratase-related protein [Methylobacterium radiodurans]|uniref:Enoyl-CoA hydratase/isomerase family protein n=1 Tax=Methylobacterium radiodurans TaxID=2202828 RepID=A0A2U8VQP7_9HYPH|nr:enoyl-CoA hydratase-related protein [Methylobacterium radiodurans]AWN35997.1 hypothetical protein DK427_09885 [Methylobacterium radiodurans]
MLIPRSSAEGSHATAGRIGGPSPPPSDRKVTVERRGSICLIGLNRPQIYNRVDPEAFGALARAYAAYDADDDLRAAVLFGHGANFSRGIDVDAFAAFLKTAKARAPAADGIDPLGRRALLRKPIVAVVHGDTWGVNRTKALRGFWFCDSPPPFAARRRRWRICSGSRTTSGQ